MFETSRRREHRTQNTQNTQNTPKILLCESREFRVPNVRYMGGLSYSIQESQLNTCEPPYGGGGASQS